MFLLFMVHRQLSYLQIHPLTTAFSSCLAEILGDKMGHVEAWGPFVSFSKVSRSLLAYGLFSWELQLCCETMYHTMLVTSFSCPLVLYITLGCTMYLEGHIEPTGESLVHM